MKTPIKYLVLVFLIIMISACDIIVTRHISEDTEENNDQTSTEQKQPNPPYDYANELKEKMKYEPFVCQYHFIYDVYQIELDEPIGWLDNIEYNDKISFGYKNKIKDGYDYISSSNSGIVKVHISLDKHYYDLINEWLAQDNLSFAEVEQMEDECMQLYDSHNFEEAYALDKEIDAYYEQIELSIENGYYNLLAPLLNGKFNFYNGYFIGIFDDLEECNSYLEVLNQIATYEYVKTISVLYDFGDLVNKELYLSYYAEYYAELRRMYEEQHIIYNIIEDPYPGMDYVDIRFIIFEGESWVAGFFFDTEKLKGFMPLQ